MILIALGVFAMVAVGAVCPTMVASYLRHSYTSYQPGFWLKVLQMLAWFMPGTGSLLLFGLATLRFDHGFSPVRRVTAWTLRVGAAYFLAFALFVIWVSMPDAFDVARWTWSVVYGLELLAFPATSWMCAHALSREGALEPNERHGLALAAGGIAIALPLPIVARLFLGGYTFFMTWLMPLWPLAAFVAWWSLRRKTPTESPAPAA